MATTTGGRFYRAQNAGQLDSALTNLPHTITVTHKKVDIAAWFAGVGGLLVAAAVALSLWWNRVRRVPTAHLTFGCRECPPPGQAGPRRPTAR